MTSKVIFKKENHEQIYGGRHIKWKFNHETSLKLRRSPPNGHWVRWETYSRLWEERILFFQGISSSLVTVDWWLHAQMKIFSYQQLTQITHDWMRIRSHWHGTIKIYSWCKDSNLWVYLYANFWLGNFEGQKWQWQRTIEIYSWCTVDMWNLIYEFICSW